MTVQTVRPNATSAAGSFTATGAASLWQATSDNSDASYAGGSGALNNPMVLGLGAYTLASNERVRTFALRARVSASDVNSVAGSVQVASGGLNALLNVNAVGTAATTYTSGQQTPASEVSNNAILDAALACMQTFSVANGLRFYELYLDLDVRAQPTISALSVGVSLGEPTYTVTFSYGTSGNFEAVNVNVVVTNDDTGVVVANLVQSVSGTDFSGQIVAIPHGEVLPNGSYTVQAWIAAPGFVAPDTSYLSAVSTTAFTVTPAGVAPPDLTCETDQALQQVCLTISQPDDTPPPSTDCLRIETFGTGAWGNQATFTGAGTEVISTVDKAQLDLTGNIYLVVWVQAPDWTPAGSRVIMSKAPITFLSGYTAYLDATGVLVFTIGTGAAVRTMTSSAPGLTDGQGYWLEFLYDNTAKTCRFRKSSDGLLTEITAISWTTISTTGAHAGGSPAANTNDLQIGAITTAVQWVGTIGLFALFNGTSTAGTLVATTVFIARPTGTAAFADGLGNTWTPTGGVTVSLGVGVLTTVGQPRHAAVWLNTTLVTPDVVFGATSVTVTGDTSTFPTFPGKLVVATTGGGASNTTLVAYQISGAGPVVHGLNSTNLIVQARVGSSHLQAVVGVVVDSVNQVTISGPFTEAVSILILTTAAVPVCVPTIDEPVAAATQDQQFAHQFSSLLTLTTFVRTSDSRVSWVGVELNAGEIVVDNDGGAGIIHVSGFLAVFDDPDAVRAEIERDGELIPADGLNGALVPPFGDGPLEVCDRFPDRFRAPDCEGDPEPTGPTYRVRFYGYVDGIISYSPWTECTPDAVISNGEALLRHPFDETLDISGCVSTENWQRIRPFAASQPVTGGIETGRSGDVSGRDFSLVIEAPNTVDELAVEALLAATYIWYAPLDVGIPTLWMMPTASYNVAGYKHPARPYATSQGFIEVEAEPVELPPAGPPAS